MRRRVMVQLIVCVLSACLIILPSSWAALSAVGDGPRAPSHGITTQGVTPLKDVVDACLATFVSVDVSPYTKTWITNGVITNGFTKWWQFQWQWSYVYTCSNGNTSNCKVCNTIEIDYQNNNSNWNWIVASGGIINGSPDSSDCNTTNTISKTTTYSYPYQAGTNMRAIWKFAPFDPSVSNDCFGQDYMEPYEVDWTIPANGP